MIGRNDVFVQVYELISYSAYRDATTHALDEPEKDTVVFEPQSLSVPFHFQLPDDLPPSSELQALGAERAYVRYSIYAYIDIKRRRDPSCRAVFSVIRSRNDDSSLESDSPCHLQVSKGVHPLFCIPPFCCYPFELECFRFGDVSLEVDTERSSYAPGEMMNIKMKTNSNRQSCPITFSLRQTATMRAEGYMRHRYRDFPVTIETADGLLRDMCITPNTVNDSGHAALIMPIVASSYIGDVGKKQLEWAALQKRNWSESRKLSRAEPLTWIYHLLVRLKLPFWVRDAVVEFPISVSSVPFGVSLTELPPDAVGKGGEVIDVRDAQEDAQTHSPLTFEQRYILAMRAHDEDESPNKTDKGDE